METPTYNETTETAPQWAVLELMGHIRYGGKVSKDNQFGTAMLRVDVPQENGSFVTQFVNPASLFRMTICDEEIARAAAKRGQADPVNKWELSHLLPERASEPPHPSAFLDRDDDDDHGEDEDSFQP